VVGSRRFAATVQDVQDHHRIGVHALHEDIARAGDDQLPRVRPATYPTKTREAAQASARFIKTLVQPRGGGWAFFRQVGDRTVMGRPRRLGVDYSHGP
jgi:hypothetical protein